jgi:hypothetical protein
MMRVSFFVLKVVTVTQKNAPTATAYSIYPLVRLLNLEGEVILTARPQESQCKIRNDAGGVKSGDEDLLLALYLLN